MTFFSVPKPRFIRRGDLTSLCVYVIFIGVCFVLQLHRTLKEKQCPADLPGQLSRQNKLIHGENERPAGLPLIKVAPIKKSCLWTKLMKSTVLGLKSV